MALKLLFIAIEFPPLNTTGTYRSLKFVKYLHHFGIQPIVVTVDRESGIGIFGNRIDENLLGQIPENTPVIRVPCKPVSKFIRQNKVLDFIRIYFNTDDKIAQKWSENLFPRLDELIKVYQPEAVYISLPPFSNHYIVTKIRNHCSLPIIVDMRDAWSQWTVSPWQTKFHYKIVLNKERRIFREASCIIGVTKELVDLFKSSHPAIPAEKFRVLPNGYDSDIPFASEIQGASFQDKEVIRIGYIGSFYYNPKSHKDQQRKWWQKKPHKIFRYTTKEEDWSYRSPLYFLKALRVLLDKYPDLENRIRFEHIGGTPEWLMEILKEMNLLGIFVPHGFVSKQRVLEIKKGFDYFLGTSEKVIGSRHYCLPSKIFDYLPGQKPILAFLTEGAQKEFLFHSGMGVFFDPDEPLLSGQRLHDIFTNGVTLRPDAEYLRLYHRFATAETLARIIRMTAKQDSATGLITP